MFNSSIVALVVLAPGEPIPHPIGCPVWVSKAKCPYEQDVMYWEEWPVRHPFLLFAGRAYNNPEYIELWKTLDGYPETQEVIRNLPIRNPLLWLMDKPVQ